MEKGTILGMRCPAGIYALLLALGCGGQPVGGKVPKAKPAHVGGAAAAAAALITLADPKAARQRQEERGGGVDKEKTKKVNETVPESVLFAPEDADKDRSDEELPPCKESTPAPKEEGGIAIPVVPTVSEGAIATPTRCQDSSQEDKDKSKSKSKSDQDRDTSRSKESRAGKE